MTIILEVRHLTTRFRLDKNIFPVIEGISFSLEAGKTLALVGESGCGKSVTAHSILRILPTPPALPSEGEILYKGVDLLSLSESEMRQIRGRSIGMIFQDPMNALNPVYTIGDQLLETVSTHLGMKEESATHHILQALEDVQLPNPREIIKAYPHQLSGGMLQRVMIALALICSPDLLIADEPTTALDVTIQSQILQTLRELQKKRQMSLLIITHDMGVVAEIADAVIVMYAGNQIEKASVDALFDNPSHPYTQALFASRPDHTAKSGPLSTIPGFVPRIDALPQGCRFHNRCPWAMELCKGGKVPFFPMKEPDHQTRCWLFDQELETKLSDEETA